MISEAAQKGDVASTWLSFSGHLLLDASHHALGEPKPQGEAMYVCSG